METLYNVLIGSLYVGAIVFVWVIVVAIVAATVQQLRKRK